MLEMVLDSLEVLCRSGRVWAGFPEPFCSGPEGPMHCRASQAKRKRRIAYARTFCKNASAVCRSLRSSRKASLTACVSGSVYSRVILPFTCSSPRWLAVEKHLPSRLCPLPSSVPCTFVGLAALRGCECSGAIKTWIGLRSSLCSEIHLHCHSCKEAWPRPTHPQLAAALRATVRTQ